MRYVSHNLQLIQREFAAKDTAREANFLALSLLRKVCGELLICVENQ